MGTKISAKNVGHIELSGVVIVSDPCYDRETWCNAKNIAMEPGIYAACIVKSDEQDLGIRVSCIMVYHLNYINWLRADWTRLNNAIGVDSGQCGIFDDTIYPTDEGSLGEHDDENSFYGECCKLTLSDAKCGVLKSRKGVVSSSGFGDGSYELFCQSHKGERVALMVDYDLKKNRSVMEAVFNS